MRRLAPLLLLALLLPACHAPVAVAPNPLEIDVSEYASMYRATQLVLREEGFALDRRSYRLGVVDTEPLGAPTIFEPWHATNTTLYQTAESTLNYQRRVVTVSMEPAAPAEPLLPESVTVGAASPATQPTPDTYLLRVEVQVQQMEVPTRQLSGTTRGLSVQRHLAAVPAEWRDRGITDSYWQPLGRDYYLEQRLLAEIVRRSIKVRG
jgi:hypothetical protein